MFTVSSNHQISTEAIELHQPTPMDQQQPPAGLVPTPPPKTSAADNSFGNIVPFIVVICIIAVVSIASCVVGRVYARRMALSTPLQRGVDMGIRPAGNWVEWIKRKLRRRKAAGSVDGLGDQAGTSYGSTDQVEVAVEVEGVDHNHNQHQHPPPGPPPQA